MADYKYQDFTGAISTAAQKEQETQQQAQQVQQQQAQLQRPAEVQQNEQLNLPPQQPLSVPESAYSGALGLQQGLQNFGSKLGGAIINSGLPMAGVDDSFRKDFGKGYNDQVQQQIMDQQQTNPQGDIGRMVGQNVIPGLAGAGLGPTLNIGQMLKYLGISGGAMAGYHILKNITSVGGE